MDSSEKTKLRNKIETDSQMESRLTAMGRQVEGGGTEQKGKRTHGHGQQCGDLAEKGDESIRRINGNGKQYGKK